MKEKLKKIINGNEFTRKAKDNVRFSVEFKYDKKHYVKYNNNKPDKEQLGYSIMKTSHALEKGMSFDKMRPFGKEKVKDIVLKLNKLEKYEGFEKSSAVIIAVNTLRKYARIYEEHNWTNEPEYKLVNDCLSEFDKIEKLETGVRTLTKEEIMKDGGIDYEKFLKSRHSIRKFSGKKLAQKDISKAIDIAKLSPSACNRQMVKVYYAEGGAADAVKTAIRSNLVGFDVVSANPFVVTFDAAAFGGSKERNQGWLNAGFFAMNFVNALHSLGIGTCFCEFQQTAKVEDGLKKKLNIPASERVAVVIMAGYYLEENKVYLSPRISSAEILRVC